jgi:hypothetical protein
VAVSDESTFCLQCKRLGSRARTGIPASADKSRLARSHRHRSALSSWLSSLKRPGRPPPPAVRRPRTGLGAHAGPDRSAFPGEAGGTAFNSLSRRWKSRTSQRRQRGGLGEISRELETAERARTDLLPNGGKQTKAKALADAGLSTSTASRPRLATLIKRKRRPKPPLHDNASKPQALRFTAASLPRSVWIS